MKTFWTIVGTLAVVGLILYAVGVNQQHMIPVLSQGTSNNGVGTYYLYVPGNGQSSCTWTWNASGTQQSFTTGPNTGTNEHDFIYNSSVSDIAVTCFSDQNVKYTGQFSN